MDFACREMRGSEKGTAEMSEFEGEREKRENDLL